MRADTSQPLLSANAVSMRYGDKQALHNLDLAIDAGESVGLLGLNGAGDDSWVMPPTPHQSMLNLQFGSTCSLPPDCAG